MSRLRWDASTRARRMRTPARTRYQACAHALIRIVCHACAGTLPRARAGCGRLRARRQDCMPRLRWDASTRAWAGWRRRGSCSSVDICARLGKTSCAPRLRRVSWEDAAVGVTIADAKRAGPKCPPPPFVSPCTLPAYRQYLEMFSSSFDFISSSAGLPSWFAASAR